MAAERSLSVLKLIKNYMRSTMTQLLLSGSRTLCIEVTESLDLEEIIAKFLSIGKEACLSSFSNGMLYSWPSPFTTKIIEDKENYDISEEQAQLFTTLPPLAMMLTCLFSSTLSDCIGRKKTMLLVIIPQVLSWTLSAVSQNLYIIYSARIFSGMGDAIIFSSLPMYIGEVSNPTVRGTWGGALTILYSLGQVSITTIGSYLSVEVSSLICITVPILFLFCCQVLPESPYYLMMKGDEANTRKVLKTLTRKEDVEDDLKQLKSDVQRQLSEQSTWKNMFMIASNRKALLAGSFLRFSQQMGGLSVSLTCTQTIFNKSGSNISSQTASIIYVSFCTILNICASSFVDKFDRKRAYISSLIPSGLIMIIMSAYFFMEENLSMGIHAGWVPMVGMLLYITFSSYGVCIIPTLMMGELFSTSIKAKSMTVLVIVFGISIFISTFLFNNLSMNFGLYAPFLLFGILNIISSVVSFYLIPETRGKTLEEIQQGLKK